MNQDFSDLITKRFKPPSDQKFVPHPDNLTKIPTPSKFSIHKQLDIQNYPEQKRFSPGQEIQALIHQAVSPLEFYLIKKTDLELRVKVEKELTSRLHELEPGDSGGICAVLYRKTVYRGTVRMGGQNDIMVSNFR